jgi:hypothetical protein
VCYVAIALGMGGDQPRSPAEVLATGYGDCKDKATIFIAMANRMGVRARPVLLAAGGRVERGLPSIYQFNHAIAAVERPSGRLFVDLTASDVPWGALPVADQGQFVLVIDPDGGTEETMTPDYGRDAMNDLTVTATLDTAGYATARTEMAVGGAFGNSLREMFTRAADSAQRASFLREAASGIYPEAEGTDLRLTDRLDSGGPFTIGFTAKNGRGAQLAGPVAILGTPFLRLGRDVKPLIAQLRERSPRKFTIDVAQVGAGGEGTVRFRLELPEGWKAELPKNVSLASAFGELDITYAQEGRVFTMVMRRSSRTGVEPPESLPKLIAWLEQVAAAERDAAGIVVRKGP